MPRHRGIYRPVWWTVTILSMVVKGLNSVLAAAAVAAAEHAVTDKLSCHCVCVLIGDFCSAA